MSKVLEGQRASQDSNPLSQSEESLNQIEHLFQQADLLMFKDQNYNDAQILYKQVLDLEPTNIDAINSLAQCIKLQCVSNNTQNQVFDLISPLYQEVLKIDNQDIEANFNMGLIYLQYKADLNSALHYFQQSLIKDKNIQQNTKTNKGRQTPENEQINQIQEIYRSQFAKAYYNVGMIYDRLGDINKACENYKRTIEKCEEDRSGLSVKSSHYVKAMTNYAVSLEKLGKREESINILDSLKGDFKDEVRIHNNLGIINKRNGNIDTAQSNYEEALSIDSNSFFPNYNMAVLKSQNKGEEQESLQYFEKALKLAFEGQEEVYQVNVLINMALVHEGLNEIENAIEKLELALKLDSENEKIIQKIIELKQIMKQMEEKEQQEQLEQKKNIERQKQQQDKEEQQRQMLIEQEKQKILEDEQKLKAQQEEADKIKQQKKQQKELLLKKKQEELLLFQEQQRQQEALNKQREEEEKQQQRLRDLENAQKEEFKEYVQSEIVQEKQSPIQSIEAKIERDHISQTVQVIQESSLMTPKAKNMENEGVQSLKLKKEGSHLDMRPIESRQSNRGKLHKDHADIQSQKVEEIINNDDEILGDDHQCEQQEEYKEEQDEQNKDDDEDENQLDNYQDQDANIDDNQDEKVNDIIEEQKPSAQEQRIEETKQEEVKEESKQDEKPSEDDENFLKWNWEQCEKKLKDDPTNIKAQYRLGVLQMQAHKYQNALDSFEAVYTKDQEFLSEQLLPRLGDCSYKLDQCEKAISYYSTSEKYIAQHLQYQIQLNKGKCYDKMKKFEDSVSSYTKSLQLYSKEPKQDQSIKGDIEFRLGWAYIRLKNNMEKGVIHLKKALVCKPNNTEILMKLAGVLFNEFTNTEDSLVYVKKVIEIEPKNSDAYILLGKIQDKLSKYKEAIEAFDQAIKIQATQNTASPPKANAFFHLGSVYEKTKEYKKCVLQYKKCLTLDNKHFGACIHLANLLANIGEGQRAAKYFKHAIRIDPNSINAHFGLGKALQQFSENKDAPIEYFQIVIKKDPNHFKAHTQLGILYLDREEYDKSADCLKKALSVNKQYPLALVSMGNLLFETGHADNAIKYHKQALKFNEKELQALIGLGNAYYDSGQPNDSISFYMKALEQDNQLSDVHYNLGNALYLVEKIDEAIVHYRAAIALNPKKSESFYNLGNALCVKSEYQNAINSYQQALEIDPKNAPALYNLGNAFYMVNRYEEAINAYLRALEQNEQSAECHFNLASAYNDMKSYQKAVGHYQRAIELDEKNIDAYLCLGGVLETLKQTDKAEKAYRGVLEQDPNNQKAKDALKKLKERK